MTLGSNLDTLDRLRSSASVLNPAEGEASAGLGKGSVDTQFSLDGLRKGCHIWVFGPRQKFGQ